MPRYSTPCPSAIEAPQPCPNEVWHPSIRNDAPILANAVLSNYEFRAYLRATGFISLHLHTQLLVHSSTEFAAAYLKNVTGLLSLPGHDPLLLDGVSVAEARSVPFEGRWVSFEVWVPVHTRMHECRSCLADLDLRFCFSFAGCPLEDRVRRVVNIRRVRDGRLTTHLKHAGQSRGLAEC